MRVQSPSIDELQDVIRQQSDRIEQQDEEISDLIDNLNHVLVQVGDRDDQLTELIQSFRVFVGGLKDDRKAILGSLDQISALSVETADLIDGIREPFVQDIRHLRSFAGNLDRNKAEIDRALQVLPIKLNKVGPTAIYGSWFNFYLCEFKGTVTLPSVVPGQPGKAVQIPAYKTGSDRCELG